MRRIHLTGLIGFVFFLVPNVTQAANVQWIMEMVDYGSYALIASSSVTAFQSAIDDMNTAYGGTGSLYASLWMKLPNRDYDCSQNPEFCWTPDGGVNWGGVWQTADEIVINYSDFDAPTSQGEPIIGSDNRDLFLCWTTMDNGTFHRFHEQNLNEYCIHLTWDDTAEHYKFADPHTYTVEGVPQFEGLANACNLTVNDVSTLYLNTDFVLGDCLMQLFFPLPGVFDGVWNDAQNGFLRKVPFGYVTLVTEIFATGTTTLPTLGYTFRPDSVFGSTTLSYDFNEIMGDSTQILTTDLVSNTDNPRNIWEIIMPTINIIMYLALFFLIIQDLTGIHMNDDGGSHMFGRGSKRSGITRDEYSYKEWLYKHRP